MELINKTNLEYFEVPEKDHLDLTEEALRGYYDFILSFGNL